MIIIWGKPLNVLNLNMMYILHGRNCILLFYIQYLYFSLLNFLRCQNREVQLAKACRHWFK
jgi:hypothetical protein